jgi:cellulose synthase (UDP-forming)
VVNLALAARYMWWLLAPGRPEQPVLYGLLVAAETFNLVQGLGFWWTLSHVAGRRRRRGGPVPIADPAGSGGGASRASAGPAAAVDVFIPTYDEPTAVVGPTVAAAAALHGADVRVVLLDDGDRPEMAALARTHGVAYLARPGSEGAKAGNINWALRRTGAPFVAILDCDHVPDPRFLEACMAEMDDARVAFVQTPQYYANWPRGGVAETSWSQQSLFFGPIARGRDALGAMFCCGTNVVFRRAALEAVGGFSQESLTEDFELSIRLHEQGWTSRYLPEVLASGLGPEDMAGYVSQQLRWARGCLGALPKVLRARLPARLRLQYLLSAGYWLTGWTFVIYMAFPIVRILIGRQPIDVSGPEEFLIYWGPYFVASMATVGLAGRGRYTYSAFSLLSASFWIHVVASILTLARRKGSFAVTPKQGATGVQLRPVAVPLAVCAVLIGVVAFGLLRDPSAATVTNASFALVHVVVLAGGIRFAFPAAGSRAPRPVPATEQTVEAVR